MLVSILIPCFNADRWIGEAIESALQQTWSEKEVIVVDDGSTDRSVEEIARFGDRIRWETGPNRGGNVARNRLLAMAQGPWLQYLDADDCLLPEKVAAQAAYVTAHPETDVVYGPVTIEYHSERGRERSLLPIPEPHDDWVLLARWFLPQTGSPLWRKQAITDVGGWNPSQRACQEHELYLRLLMAGKQFRYLDHNGAIYRFFGGRTLSTADPPRTRRLRLDIEDRAEAFLRERGELTPSRLTAINVARFESARTAWHDDRQEAIAIDLSIRRSQPDFVPSGRAAPPSYQRLYRWFGFAATETLADFRRRIGTS